MLCSHDWLDRPVYTNGLPRNLYFCPDRPHKMTTIAKPRIRTHPTRTADFGSNGWVNHDASAYYGRDLAPIWGPVDGTLPIETGENEWPFDDQFMLFNESSQFMDVLPDRSVHLMVTSPPYNVGKQYEGVLTVDEHVELIKSVLAETFRVLVDGGRACVNVANIGRKPYIPLHAYVICAAAQVGFTMRGEIVWQKGMNGSSTAWGSWLSPSNPTLRDTHEYILVFQKGEFGRKPPEPRLPSLEKEDFLEWTKSVWEFPATSAKAARHPAPFPQELPRRLINLYTFQDEVVLDPFMGTGNACIAALANGRRFVGFDIDGDYLQIARERIAEAGVGQSVLRDLG